MNPWLALLVVPSLGQLGYVVWTSWPRPRSINRPLWFSWLVVSIASIIALEILAR